MVKQIKAVVGLQWGDEGKGKLVDSLMGDVDICARFNGGANAGHTIKHDGKTYAFHLLPSGLVRETTENYLGNGVVCHIESLINELSQFDSVQTYRSRLFISERTSVLLDLHKLVDAAQENMVSEVKKIGTTKRGIGPCYTDKIARRGIRFADLLNAPVFTAKVNELATFYKTAYPLDEEIQKYNAGAEIRKHLDEFLPLFKDQIVNGLEYMQAALQTRNKSILAEGANATMLDIDHGTYPFVTSSSTIAGGICTGLGVSPHTVGSIYGVVKAYTTRVGAGPFPTEDHSDDHLLVKGHEYGTTTGRPRRCGWLDLVILRYAIFLNGTKECCLTKLDVLSGLKELKICTNYKLRGESKGAHYYPSSVEDLAEVEPEYINMEGWSEDISKCRRMEDLPPACQNYVTYIEASLGVKFTWIGVGPERTSTIVR